MRCEWVLSFFILFLGVVKTVGYLLVEVKDGDFFYYLSGCSVFPVDHPLVFVVLRVMSVFFGGAELAVLFFECLVYVGVMVMVFVLVFEVFGDLLVGSLCGVLSTSFLVVFNGSPLKNVFGVFLFLVFVFLLVRFDRGGGFGFVVGLGLVFVLGVLSHVVFSFFGVFIVLVYLVRRFSVKGLLVWVFMGLLVVGVTLCSFFVSNLKVFYLFSCGFGFFGSNLLLVFGDLMLLGFLGVTVLVFVFLVFFGGFDCDWLVFGFGCISVGLLFFGYSLGCSLRFFMMLPFVGCVLLGFVVWRLVGWLGRFFR